MCCPFSCLLGFPKPPSSGTDVTKGKMNIAIKNFLIPYHTAPLLLFVLPLKPVRLLFISL